MRSRLNHIAVVLFLIGSVVACGFVDESSTLQDATATSEKEPLFVLTGGFWTCGGDGTDPSTHGVATKFSEIRKAYSDRNNGKKLDFISSCFAGMRSNTVYYYSSGDRNVRPTMWNDQAPLQAEIESFGDRDIYFIGHSYGGWLAMELAKLNSGRGLVTIDPISPNHCAQGGVLGGAVRSWFGGGGTPGCTSFPPDLTQTEYTGLKADYNWYHYYQDQYAPLHSNVVMNTGRPGNANITAGGNGLRIHFPGGGGSYGGVHSIINLNAEIWRDIAVNFKIEAKEMNLVGPATPQQPVAPAGSTTVQPRVTDDMAPILGARAAWDETSPAEGRFAETGVWEPGLKDTAVDILNDR